MKKVALIMAGGRGERFWPKSRRTMPKQFLALTDSGKTMIQLTVDRITPLVNKEDIFISTNQDYKQLVMEQLPQIPEENIICEPVGRNTAPCIGLGAIHMAEKYGDAVMLVLPSDHLIKNTAIFLNTLEDACQTAESGVNLVTIGITPDAPETGYGYIQFIPDQMLGRAYRVDHFVEKPDLDTAKEYVASGKYLWNSGMFIWKISTILDNLKKHLPAVYDGLMTIRDTMNTEKGAQVLDQVFQKLPSESIDYGVMEKAKNIYILGGAFGWDDVGSWLAVGRLQKSNEFGNVIAGNAVTIDTRNSIIQGGKKLIATVGLQNIIIVDTEDALLVCDKGGAGNIKRVLENLKICNRNEYL